MINEIPLDTSFCRRVRTRQQQSRLDWHTRCKYNKKHLLGPSGEARRLFGEHGHHQKQKRKKFVIMIVLPVLCYGAISFLATTGQWAQVTSVVVLAEASSTMHRQSQTRRPQQNQNQNQNKTQNQYKPTGSNRFAKMMVTDDPKDTDALSYLQRYGYMNESSSSNQANLISEDAFHEAVMTFQRFAGIPETGVIDNQTVKYMQMPRCGNKDRSGRGENGKRKKRKRRKRYALQGSKWRRSELTYRISQYPTRFQHKKHEVDAQIEKAFKIWSQVAPIDFVVKKEGRVHIDIRFASGEHGDGDPFDGPGNTLAHAYFPQYGGDAHFDDQEYWTIDSYAGTNIFQVAAHELGHSLGLGHSSVREALMAPFYQKYKPNFKLHADDILGIQGLYGEKTDHPNSSDDTPTRGSTTSSSSSTTTTTTTEQPDVFDRRHKPRDEADDNQPEAKPNEPDDGGGGGLFGSKPADLCLDSGIDAITRTADGSTYVFKGQHYWLIKMEGLASGYPQRIQKDWDGLPGNLDAALTWADGKTFFFKGDKYWRFSNRRREPGYPKLISSGFAGIPNNVDAAFVWSGNGKTYFFKGSQYWRFDSKQEPPVSSQYPKSIKNWSGLPTSGIDAAFQWENSMTYFFKEDLYWRFDDREFEVDSSAKPSFPRSTGEWWFGCTSSNLPQRRKPTNSYSSDGEGDNENDDLVSSSSSSSFVSSRHRPLGASRPTFSSSATRAASGDSQEDWSFHRGVGEEARRQIFLKRQVGQSSSSSSSGTRTLVLGHNNYPSSSSSHDSNNNRWSLTMGDSHPGEQSMSEIKMAPSGSEGEATNAPGDSHAER